MSTHALWEQTWWSIMETSQLHKGCLGMMAEWWCISAHCMSGISVIPNYYGDGLLVNFWHMALRNVGYIISGMFALTTADTTRQNSSQQRPNKAQWRCRKPIRPLVLRTTTSVAARYSPDAGALPCASRLQQSYTSPLVTSASYKRHHATVDLITV